jgi:type IV secretion system protein VirD4
VTASGGWRPPSWGPQTEIPGQPDRTRVLVSVLLLCLALSSTRILDVLLMCALVIGAWRLRRRVLARTAGRPAPWSAAMGAGLPAVLEESRRLGGGVYLGTARPGGWRLARPERAVLLLGPPRSGKTSGVIVPALLCHDGPAVSTSTKPDVLAATAAARSQLGRVWRFDPTGTTDASGMGEELRWSPVAGSWSWDGALLMARSMVTGAGVGLGTTDASHWSRRAQALLAPLLHAAAVSELGIDRVHRWVLAHDLDTPGTVLEGAGAELPAGILAGLGNTEARERSSIFSAAADALDAYSSQAALTAAVEPNFDAEEFVRSADTIYVHAPAESQQLAAPLVCGLLAEIRAATYRAHATGGLPRRVLFALDEVANIAPIGELPQIASEGGGQGLVLVAALQDLSQARARWGHAADGFLTLFGTKLILPGIADSRTLESVSIALGEYDRPTVSTTRSHTDWLGTRPTRTFSTQRQRVLSPGEIAGIPQGRAMHLDGVTWELVGLTPGHTSEPWRTLSSGSGR